MCWDLKSDETICDQTKYANVMDTFINFNCEECLKFICVYMFYIEIFYYKMFCFVDKYYVNMFFPLYC